MKNRLPVKLGLHVVILQIVFVVSLFADNAHAISGGRFQERMECLPILKGQMQTRFRGPAEELLYMNKYLSCWGESMIIRAKSPRHSYLGEGLKVFSNPAYVEAVGFSQRLCRIATANLRNTGDRRTDYPCWFSAETALAGVTIEEAARKESPRILFSGLYSRKGEDLIEYTYCLNDDPTQPKEYSKSCKRFKKMYITEFGRGDINGDGIDDMLVNIKFFSSNDPRPNCYIAGFTRNDRDFFKLISYSPMGPCE